jgi:hypothetical protein
MAKGQGELGRWDFPKKAVNDEGLTTPYGVNLCIQGLIDNAKVRAGMKPEDTKICNECGGGCMRNECGARKKKRKEGGNGGATAQEAKKKSKGEPKVGTKSERVAKVKKPRFVNNCCMECALHGEDQLRCPRPLGQSECGKGQNGKDRGMANCGLGSTHYFSVHKATNKKVRADLREYHGESLKFVFGEASEA